MASMHFWGVEVKGKEPTRVSLEEGQVIHISQATLSELKKDNEPVLLHLRVGDEKFVLGVLSQNTPQLSFDLVLERDFEITHNWKNGSVHILGYDSDAQEDDLSDFSEDEDEDVPAAVPLKENGKPLATGDFKPAVEKAIKDKKAKPEPKAEEDDEDDSDEDDDDDDSEHDSDSDEEMATVDGDSDEDSDDDEDDDDSDEEETPKPESGKKRSKPDVKTPEAKKAKLATPQKTDGKKGNAHVATPHPSKKAGKSGEKQSPKSSKSGGKFSCSPCNRSFNNEVGLQSHNKAKHAK